MRPSIIALLAATAFAAPLSVRSPDTEVDLGGLGMEVKRSAETQVDLGGVGMDLKRSAETQVDLGGVGMDLKRSSTSGGEEDINLIDILPPSIIDPVSAIADSIPIDISISVPILPK
jgi:hypothetical protein